MNHWIEEALEILDSGQACVLLTIAGVRGSAPREVGAKMIVTATETFGTIGGGQLEYKCTRSAVDLLRNNPDAGPGVYTRRYPLGADCGQCCGGVVDVLYERLDDTGDAWLRELTHLHRQREPVVMATGLRGESQKHLVTAAGTLSFSDTGELLSGTEEQARRLLAGAGPAGPSTDSYLLEPVLTGDFSIAVFGAGHVGAATVDLLSKLECTIRWIDSRRNAFPSTAPANVSMIESDSPVREVAAMPAGTYYLVMTHSHPLDFDICSAILARPDVAYCGLIGSRTKRRRFEKLARGLGMSAARLDTLTCPIGVDGMTGKKPVEIAIAVTAQLLQVRDTSTGSVRKNVRAADNVRAL